MSLIRNLKTVYKSLLIGIGKSKIGNSISSFLSGTVSIMQEEGERQNRDAISARLMVSRLIGDADGKEICSSTLISSNALVNEKIDVDSIIGDCDRKADDGVHGVRTAPKKIKVRVMHCNPGTFNAIETISESFQKDIRYNLKIILMQESGNSFGLSKQMEAKGFDYVFDNEYDVKTDRPDITIFYQLEYIYTDAIFEARKYSKMVVLVPLTLTTIWYGERSISRMHLKKFQPDIIFATDLVMDRMNGNALGVKLLKMVPPQVDTVYRKLSGGECYPEGWEKLKGKKVMFYMTDHGLRQYTVSAEVSFDLYISTLVEYIKKADNEGVGLIIRPHFALIRELLAYYWSVDDYRSFVDFCNKSPNIVWDETNDFMNGLAVCDAVLSDLNTSVTYFSLASMKPIAVTLRYDMPVENNNEDLTDGLYIVHSRDNFIQFMDMIKAGKDPKKEKRKALFNRLIAPFDGENGRRIKEAIEQEYRVLS